jgi:hypothetical protein
MKSELDASVGLKWVLRELDSPKADAIRLGRRSRSHDLIAPDELLDLHFQSIYPWWCHDVAALGHVV